MRLGLRLRPFEVRGERVLEVRPGLENLVELIDERWSLRTARNGWRQGVVEVGGDEMRRERLRLRSPVAGRHAIEAGLAGGQPAEQQRAAGSGEADGPRLLGDLLADQAAQLAVLARATDATLDVEPQRFEVDVLARRVAQQRLANALELGRELLGGRRAQRLRVQPRPEQLNLLCGEIRPCLPHEHPPFGCALVVTSMDVGDIRGSRMK